jgi:threonylcarbamoyladenosine tRNA methylthiotransferase MtaB
MPLRVSFYTLGCKLNQLEAESIADAFAREGALVRPFEAGTSLQVDLVVVNTCTVTGKAERSARRILRLALEACPGAVVLVTGCYAQVEAEAIAAMDDRILVLPGEDKAALLALPPRLAEARSMEGAGGPADLLALLRRLTDDERRAVRGPGARSAGIDPRFAFNPETFAFHSRPALKIQDGCDNDCAYCRVRIARGRSASLPAAEALARARALERAGRAELVLTGVNLSQYRDGDRDFPALLAFLVAGTESLSFRISSYEPDAINPAFLDAFAHPRVRPHVHLAVQSGADSLLFAMGRHYTRADVFAAVRALRAARDDPFIAADFIVGFPGETEADFAASLELARDCDFARIHAFRFSPRPGTRAASSPDRVPERVAGERACVLSELGKASASRYLKRWKGRTLKAVLEKDLCATAENYLKLKPHGFPESARPGDEILCRVEEASLPGFGSVDALSLYIADPPLESP